MKYLKWIMLIFAVITVFAFVYVNNNSSSNISKSASSTKKSNVGTKVMDNEIKAIISDGYQYVEFDLSYSDYANIIVQKDIPVRIVINVDEEYLTGCNRAILINEFDIEKKLSTGENIIEFIPKEVGNYTYTCSMRMIKNNIRVVDNLDNN